MNVFDRLADELQRRVSEQDLIAALKGLPDESAHCAELAVNTLRATLRNV